MTSSKKSKWNVVEKSSGKILDTMDSKMFANMHYHVQKGWAKVIEAKPGDKIKTYKESNMDLKTIINQRIAESILK